MPIQIQMFPRSNERRDDIETSKILYSRRMTNDNWRVFIFNNPPFGVSKSIRVTGFSKDPCADWISSESCANALHRSKCLRVEIRG